MKYMLLIYADEQVWTEVERERCYGESTQVAHTLKSNGQYLAAPRCSRSRWRPAFRYVMANGS
jgi:hypothetical protein